MRNLDPTLQAGLAAAVIEPVIFVMLTFKSKACYVCSAGYDVTWNGQLYTGIGTLGGISAIRERTEIKADGITLSLSGIDSNIVAECMADIQALAPARCWIGLMNRGQLIGVPYCFFSGVVDRPTFVITPQSSTISLALETRMALLNRASQRRYTSADQHAFGYPDDTGFAWVEKLNDIALRWGN